MTVSIASSELIYVGPIKEPSVYFFRLRGLPVAAKRLSYYFIGGPTYATYEILRNKISMLGHPYIVKHIGYSEECGLLITEYIAGGDLASALFDKARNLSNFTRMRIGYQVALAMHWLERNNIVHGNLNPENILLDENNAKLGGFSYSNLIQKGNYGYRSPCENFYVAPEVQRYDELCTIKSDVYSFGVLLYVLLTGKRPSAVRNIGDLKRDIKNSLNIAGVDQELIEMIMRCWESIPASRPTFEQLYCTIGQYFLPSVETCGDFSAMKYWSVNYSLDESVPWDDFICHLLREVDLHPRLPDNPSDVELQNARDSQLEEFSAISIINQNVVEEEFKRRYRVPNWNENPERQQYLYAVRVFPECFRLLLKQCRGNKINQVTLHDFGTILQWFGPFCDSTGNIQLIKKMITIAQQPWFFGFIDEQRTEVFMSLNRTPGSYLVRCSSQAGQFTIAHWETTENLIYSRFTVKMIYPSAFLFDFEGCTFNDWSELKKKLGLKNYCPGSDFVPVATESKLHGKYKFKGCIC